MIVGLTGGIASGKTFCTDYLSSTYAIHIVDADLLAREVVQIGSEGLAQIRAEFGDIVITDDGSLNRAKMREIMIADAQARQKLNEITHPRVRQLMRDRLAQYTYDEANYQIMSVPLLLENKLERYADVVVVIDVDRDTQIKRLHSRDGSDATVASKMLAAQTSREGRITRANYVIDNSRGKSETTQQLDSLHQILCGLGAVRCGTRSSFEV
ncbi:dephospho-CoA kinase [Cardiobacteriaceae bacterium TAE3-ERU3]|nr:dephospho-CoA kinase [Cardiobacteriaceae bacterium TAE3-ERU3]